MIRGNTNKYTSPKRKKNMGCLQNIFWNCIGLKSNVIKTNLFLLIYHRYLYILIEYQGFIGGYVLQPSIFKYFKSAMSSINFFKY